jgi:predicted nucleic acid-binding protein
VKTVFVDTSGFYAVLDGSDPFHAEARAAFERAEREKWTLRTTSYVVHETWALTQHRLGWSALDDFLDVMLPLCQVEFVDVVLHASGAARCRQARLRQLSLTDCVSLEFMKREGITEAIARDVHFARDNVVMP